MHSDNYQRRSGRLSRSVPVRVHWADRNGTPRVADASTLLLSRYGCCVRCSSQERVARDVIVEDVKRRMQVSARVVYREIGEAGAFVLALEFAGTDNFWGVDFPIASAAGDSSR